MGFIITGGVIIGGDEVFRLGSSIGDAIFNKLVAFSSTALATCLDGLSMVFQWLRSVMAMPSVGKTCNSLIGEASHRQSRAIIGNTWASLF